GQGEDEDAAPGDVRELDRRAQRLVPEVGAQGDRVDGRRRVLAEEGLAVGVGGGADVAALDVEHGEAAGPAQLGQRPLEDRDPLRAEDLEEGRLRLDRSDRSAEGLDTGHREALEPSEVVGQAPRLEQAAVRVDAHAQRTVLGHRGPQPYSEGGHRGRHEPNLSWAMPTTSPRRSKPRSATSRVSSLPTRDGAVGSLKAAVPTWIALAPAATSSSASRP